MPVLGGSQKDQVGIFEGPSVATESPHPIHLTSPTRRKEKWGVEKDACEAKSGQDKKRAVNSRGLS